MPQRVPVDSLTEAEKVGLRQAGRDVPAAGFVDIAMPKTPELVDQKAKERARVVKELNSVVQVPQEEAPKDKAPEVPQDKDVQGPGSQDQGPVSKSRCQHCGGDLTVRAPQEPTREEMQDFLRSVMGGEVYTKEHSLFGGNVLLSLRTRTEQEDEEVRAAIRCLIRTGRVENEQDLINRVRRIHLAISIGAMTLGKNSLVFAPLGCTGAGEGLLKEVDARLGHIPTQLLAALYKVFDDFTMKTSIMVSRAQDPVFWIGSAPTP